MSNLILVEKIKNKISFIRERKVMLDRDLAEMYGIETRALTQAVRRNLKRFPVDFMFILEEQEFNFLISQSVISKRISRGGILVYGDRFKICPLFPKCLQKRK